MSAAVKTAEWHAARAQVVGGSEVAALYGVQQPYQMGLYALWHVKAGMIEPPPVEGERIDWGNDLEAAIATVAARREGWTISQGGQVQDAQCPGLGCTLDFVIEDAAGNGCLEVKNVDGMVFKNKWQDGEPPIHILLQLQHQLAATGYSWGVVASLVNGNKLELYRYEARPKLIADIRARVAAFWKSIRENKPPAIDGSDSAFYALRELTPDLVDDAICLDGDNRFPEACAELAEVLARKKTVATREKELKAEIELKLGEHKRGWGSGWAANFIVNGGSEGTLITPEMVGTYMGGREGHRYIKIKEYEVK